MSWLGSKLRGEAIKHASTVACGVVMESQPRPLGEGSVLSACRRGKHTLIVVMTSLAVLYLLLGAEFLAAAQVIVYAGAIMVLFTFVVMLLNAGREERTLGSRAARARRASRRSSPSWPSSPR